MFLWRCGCGIWCIKPAADERQKSVGVRTNPGDNCLQRCLLALAQDTTFAAHKLQSPADSSQGGRQETNSSTCWSFVSRVEAVSATVSSSGNCLPVCRRRETNRATKSENLVSTTVSHLDAAVLYSVYGPIYGNYPHAVIAPCTVIAGEYVNVSWVWKNMKNPLWPQSAWSERIHIIHAAIDRFLSWCVQLLVGLARTLSTLQTSTYTWLQCRDSADCFGGIYLQTTKWTHRQILIIKMATHNILVRTVSSYQYSNVRTSDSSPHKCHILAIFTPNSPNLNWAVKKFLK